MPKGLWLSSPYSGYKYATKRNNRRKGGNPKEKQQQRQAVPKAALNINFKPTVNKRNRNRNVSKQNPDLKYKQSAEKWVHDMIDCSKPFRIPRMIPTLTACKSLPIVQETVTTGGAYGALFVYPSYKNTIKWFHQSPVENGAIDPNVDWTFSSFTCPNAEIFLSMPLKYTATEPDRSEPRNIEVGYVDDNDSYYFSNSGHLVRGRKCFLKGEFVFMNNPTTPTLNMYNSDSAGSNVTMNIYAVGGPTFTLRQSITQFVPGHQVTQFVFDDIAGIPIGNIAFSIRYSNPETLGHIGGGTYVSPQEGNFTCQYNGEGQWFRRGYDRGFGTSLTSQFNESSSISYTGCSVLITNDSAQLLKGGHLVAAQLPSDSSSHFQQSPAALYSYIATQTRKPFYSESLATGAFASYTPDKLEDMFFKGFNAELTESSVSGETYTRPVLAFAWKVPDTVQTAQLTFTIHTRMELISDDISMDYLLGPRDPHQLMSIYLALAADEFLISENPNHLQSMVKWAKNIAKNPAFQEVFKKTVIAGGTALLSAI